MVQRLLRAPVSFQSKTDKYQAPPTLRGARLLRCPDRQGASGSQRRDMAIEPERVAHGTYDYSVKLDTRACGSIGKLAGAAGVRQES